MPNTYLAIDLGAESGRLVAGLWNGKTIRLEEIHRFPNGPVYLGDSLRWDVVRLWAEIQNGLSLAARKYGPGIVSVGADTWGVDYVLLDERDEMLGQPFAYRDARTNGMMEKASEKCLGRKSLPRPACSSCSSTPCSNCWPINRALRRCSKGRTRCC